MIETSLFVMPDELVFLGNDQPMADNIKKGTLYVSQWKYSTHLYNSLAKETKPEFVYLTGSTEDRGTC